MTKNEKALTALVNKITSGAWIIGEKIPPEAELCKLFEVGRNTLREAVAALEQQGVLQRMQGCGTFLRQPPALSQFDAGTPITGRGSDDIHVFYKCHHSNLDADYYGRDIIHELSSRLSERGQRLTLEAIPSEAALMPRLVMRADALSNGCIFMSGLIPDDRGIRLLATKRTPVALLGTPAGQEPIAHVGHDDEEEIRIAIRHLAAHGYKRIAMVNGTSAYKYHYKNIEAYKETLAEFSLPFDPELIGEAEPYRFNDAKTAVNSIFERCPNIDALAVSGDRAILGALEIIRHRNLSIPHDIALFMMGELPWIQELSPVRLTGTRHDLRGMAIKLLDILDGLKTGLISPSEQALLPPIFIQGRSCGCVPPPELKA